jgi:hypothetical protein
MDIAETIELKKRIQCHRSFLLRKRREIPAFNMIEINGTIAACVPHPWVT